MIPSCLLVIAVASPSTVHAEVRSGGRTLYTLEKTHEATGNTARIHSVYRDRSGAPVLVMKAELVAGRPVHVEADHRQTGARGRVRLEPGRVHFERVDPDGDVDKSSQEAMGVVLVGPELTHYIQSDEAWRRLMRDEPVPIRIAAWEQMDTYGFELRRVESRDRERVVVQMRPSSWVVRAFVERMVYTFDASSRRLLRYAGPVGVKRKDADGELSPMTAEVVYRRAAEPQTVARNPACPAGEVCSP